MRCAQLEHVAHGRWRHHGVGVIHKEHACREAQPPRGAAARLDFVGVEGAPTSTLEALERAREEGVDLVMIAEKSDPPVCKIVDYGKLRYQKDKKKKEQAKKAKTNEIKEVKMSYKIGEGDYDVRKKRADKFIKNGNRVKLSIQFRGREQQHMSLGDDLIARFIDDLEEAGANIAKTKTIREGRDLTTILSQKS